MKKIITIIFTMMLVVSCNTETEQESIINDSERRPQVECGVATLPDGIDRQDVIDRLNQEFEIINGHTAIQAKVSYNKRDKQIQFDRLWNGGVQYNFTITDERGDTTNGCVTFNTISAVEFFDFNGRQGVYQVTFDDYPEVIREYSFEITRGR